MRRPVDPRELAASSPSRTPARLATPSVPAWALLPLRFFFGATFLYAGLDKLLDPAFFDASSPASIFGQLAAFTRVSPVADLVRIAEPFALPLGVLIALAEIAIGIGALTGLAFRLAASGGAALSLLFWLTASWGTHPYYYGPDLPYAAGWIVLALAGSGGLLIPRQVRGLGQALPEAAARPLRAGFDRSGRVEPDVSPERRALLQAGVLAVAALAVASVAAPLRLFRHETRAAEHASAGGGTAIANPPPVPPASAAPEATAGGATPGPSTGGVAVAKVADVERRGASSFTIPPDAPGSLPAGDPAVIVRLADGSFVAFDAVCTHAGCTVEWDRADGVLLCPCHGAAFDPANNAAVLGGPTDQPLASLPIRVDRASGTILLGA